MSESFLSSTKSCKITFAGYKSYRNAHINRHSCRTETNVELLVCTTTRSYTSAVQILADTTN